MRERGIAKLACLANSHYNVDYDQWTNYFCEKSGLFENQKQAHSIIYNSPFPL